jgi:hypothetical protein
MNQLRCCIEKPLPQEENILDQLQSQSRNANHYRSLKASFYTSKLWPDGQTIKVSFNGAHNSNAQWTSMNELENRRGMDGELLEIDPLEEVCRGLDFDEAVKLVVKERIMPIANLNFEFVGEGQGDVRVGFSGQDGAWSLLGTDCLLSNDSRTMNFGWMDVTTIIHEFGHAIGLIHEHQNPRGVPIDWDEEAVYAWAASTQGWSRDVTYHNIIQRYAVDQTNGSDYDSKSIMHYFFAPELTMDRVGVDANLILSPMDTKWIGKVYAPPRIDPAKWYYETYGVKLNEGDDDPDPDPEPETDAEWKWWYTLLVVLAALFVLSHLVFIVWNNRERPEGYFDSPTSSE